MKIDIGLSQNAYKEGYNNGLKQLEMELYKIALQLDKWAQQSIDGGWSTHQVDAMRRFADALRKTANIKRENTWKP